MNLKLSDLAALSKADENTRTIGMGREVFVDPKSRDRLIEAKMIEPGGKVTPEGVSTIEVIRKRELKLRRGIPFSERQNRDTRRLCRETPEPWFFTLLGKDQIVTNGELLFVGVPEALMAATRGGDDLRKLVTEVIQKCGSKGMKQIWAHSYQSFSLGGVDVVWMANDAQDLMIPIQAKYKDFVSGRFPRGSFWGVDYSFPIQVKVRSKGVSGNTVAIIAPFDVAKELKTPEKIDEKEWRKNGTREKVPSKDVPSVEEGN